MLELFFFFFLSKSLDGSLELTNVSTNDGLDLLAVLEENKSRHGSDTVLSSDIRAFINVDLDKVSLLNSLAQPLDNRGNHLARAAPDGVKVNDGKTREGNLLLEVLETLDLLDHFVCSTVKIAGAKCGRKG